MAFTFRIIFSGLCAFIPDEPFGGHRPPRSMLVLLPNALEPRLLKPPEGDNQSETEKKPVILPPHFPLLLAQSKYLQASQHPQDSFIKEKNGRLVVVPLVKEDISIWPDGREPRLGGLHLIDGHITDPHHPSPEEEEYLFWLTKVDDILGGGQHRIHPRLLGPLGPDEKEVVARLRLGIGRLRVHKLSKTPWQYLPLGVPIKDPGAGKRVATELSFEFEAEEKVKLVFRSFGSSTPLKLIFAPAPNEPNEDVEIEVRNLEPDRFLEMPAGVLNPAPEVDPDFSIYYDLLDGYSDGYGYPRPVPRRVPPASGPIAGDGKPCSPLGMNQ
jgi:hypothetical protein